MPGPLDDHAEAARIATLAGEALVSLRDELVAAEAPAGVLKFEGDRRAHDLILDELRRVRRDDIVLSEEGPDDQGRLGASRVWIVDPLDGTREFSESPRTDWAVHVALVVGGVPVAGAVALPGLGVTLSTAEPPTLPPTRHDGPPRVIVSRPDRRPPPSGSPTRSAAISSRWARPAPRRWPSSAARPRSTPTPAASTSGTRARRSRCAAARAPRERIDGSPLRYNQADVYLPDLLVCRPELARQPPWRCAEVVTRRPADARGPAAHVLSPDRPPARGSSTHRRVHDRTRGGTRRSGPPCAARLPRLIAPRRLPARRRRAHRVGWHLGRAIAGWWLFDRRAGGSPGPGRDLPTPAGGRRATRSHLHQARPDHLQRRGHLPRRARRRVHQVPRPGARRALRGGPRRGRGRTRSPARRGVRRSSTATPLAAASIAQVHRAAPRGPRRHPVEVVVKVQRPSVGRAGARTTSRSWPGWRPFLVGRIPDHGAGQPAGARRGVRPDHRRGARLPPRGRRTCSTSPSRSRPLGQRRVRHPPPAPRAGHPPRARDGATRTGSTSTSVARDPAAGIDTHEVVRSGMIGFLEGCHDPRRLPRRPPRRQPLRDGPTARPRCSTSASPAASRASRRVAFLRLLVGVTMNDVRGQLARPCDLGALPPDTDLDEVIADLGLDGPPIDPTTLTRDELVDELQRVVKALLGYGARMPNELMLFAKNMVFLDARHRPPRSRCRPLRRDHPPRHLLRHHPRCAHRRRGGHEPRGLRGRSHRGEVRDVRGRPGRSTPSPTASSRTDAS